jgi:cytidylate kinase
MVGKKMRLRVINYTLRNMAKEIGMEFEGIHEKRGNDPSFDYLLDKNQKEMFDREQGAVLGSRLAIWLADANLYVWLDGDLKTRAKRISRREKITLKEAIDKTQKRDGENALQYKKLYGIDVGKHGFADLKIDTGKLSALEVAEKIAREAQMPSYNKVRKNKYAAGMQRRISIGLGSARC